MEVDTTGMEDFNLALQDAELFEARSNGLNFSWWNNQDDSPISKKIDHALVNQSWGQKFPDALCDFLEPQQSDHAPCLSKMPSIARRVTKPFKFFHHVTDHPEYLNSVKEASNCESIVGSMQFKLTRSIKLMKKVLRKLNSTHYSGITHRVKDQAAKVTTLQCQLLTAPDPATARLEHEERTKWNTLAKAEEKFYHQRSRVRWHHLRDRDTAFYHKTVV